MVMQLYMLDDERLHMQCGQNKYASSNRPKAVQHVNQHVVSVYKLVTHLQKSSAHLA